MVVCTYASEDLMKITVQNRPSYGKDRIYPVCETSKFIAQYAERKTFDIEALEALQRLGFEIEYQPTPDPAKPTNEK